MKDSNAELIAALLKPESRRNHKPEPVPYARVGQQEMWAGRGAEL